MSDALGLSRKILAQLLQLLIPGQLCLQVRQLGPQAFPLGCLCRLGLQLLLRRLPLGGTGLPPGLGLFQLALGLFQLLRLGQQGGDSLPLSVQLFQLLAALGVPLPVLIQEGLQKLHRLLDGQLSRPGPLPLGVHRVLPGAEHPVDILLDAGSSRLTLPL